MYQKFYKERPTELVNSFMNERNKEIYRLRTEGICSTKEIGKKFNIGKSRVYEITKKMKNAMENSERIHSPKSEFDRIEALLHPNSLIINCLKSEGVETIADLRDLLHKIDFHRYGIPKIGERSIKRIREVLKELESA